MKKPIVYHGLIETRFGETDMYGHISAKHFLDYVVSMRWAYLKKTLGITANDLVEQGLGFFLIHSDINYKRSIQAGMTLNISSQIDDIRDTTLKVSFKIENHLSQKLHSDGCLTFAIMDLKTMRRQAMPEWSLAYFFESEPKSV